MRHGYSTFIAESDIEGADCWASVIQGAIDEADCVVAICSTSYGDTVWTKREFEYADGAKKLIVPLWHSGTFPPKPLALYLAGVNRVPRGNDPLASFSRHEEVFEQLVKALAAKGVPPRQVTTRGTSSQVAIQLLGSQGSRALSCDVHAYLQASTLARRPVARRPHSMDN